MFNNSRNHKPRRQDVHSAWVSNWINEVDCAYRAKLSKWNRNSLKTEQVRFGLPFGSDSGGSLALGGAAVTRIGAACGADNPRSSDVDAD